MMARPMRSHPSDCATKMRVKATPKMTVLQDTTGCTRPVLLTSTAMTAAIGDSQSSRNSGHQRDLQYQQREPAGKHRAVRMDDQWPHDRLAPEPAVVGRPEAPQHLRNDQ